MRIELFAETCARLFVTVAICCALPTLTSGAREAPDRQYDLRGQYAVNRLQLSAARPLLDSKDIGRPTAATNPEKYRDLGLESLSFQCGRCLRPGPERADGRRRGK